MDDVSAKVRSQVELSIRIFPKCKCGLPKTHPVHDPATYNAVHCEYTPDGPIRDIEPTQITR
jgi:hypothetical protein